ncbi:MAG: hypothetical protein K6A40_08510 [Solobacterium sp.]|nr:hypothetical protein [Solobacterium sp.]
MNRKAITVMTALILTGTLLSACKKEPEETPSPSPAPSSDVSVLPEDLPHGKLKSISYFSGGGMEGGTDDAELSFMEDGTVQLKTTYSEAHMFPLLVCTYEADEALMQEIAEWIDTYHLCGWSQLPKSEIEVLDAPSTSLIMRFDDHQSYTISDDRELPDGGGKILDHVEQLIRSAAREEKMKEFYLQEWNEDPVYTGRDDILDDDTAKWTLQGYWRCEDPFICAEFEGENVSLMRAPNTPYEDYSYELFPFPHEDADCCFHVVLDNEAQTVLWLEKGTLKMAENDTVYTLRRGR